MTSDAGIGRRRRLKHAVAAGCGRALRWSGGGGRFFRSRLPIVFYHGVWPVGSPALAQVGGLDLDQLRRDLTLLAAHFDFVGLGELLRNADDRRGSGRPRLTVCFDDGCDMVRSGAIDILESLGVPATMFVVTACTDNRHLMWMHKFQAISAARGPERLLEAYNRLMAQTAAGPDIGNTGELTAAAWCWPMDRKDEYADELWRACDMPPIDAYMDEHRPYMTTDELRRWLDHGHGIGLHTHSHPFCDRLAAADLDAEIVAPAAWLRRQLGTREVPFAYPFGNRLPVEQEARVASEAGLTSMLGVSGLSPRGTAPRELERVSGEDGLDRALFGKPALEALLGAAWPRERPRATLAVRYPHTWTGLAVAGSDHGETLPREGQLR